MTVNINPLAAAGDKTLNDSPPIVLRSIRGFHVGGESIALQGMPTRHIETVPGISARVSDPNGHYAVGQLYVQHFALASPSHRYPLMMWHGGGMTGATWEETPDGRPGWHDYFMRSGFDTYVSDAVERGRASWAPFPSIVNESPEHRTIEQAWPIFRFGPQGGYTPEQGRVECFDGSLFPAEHIVQLAKQFVARWTINFEMMRDAYVALLRRTGPAIILAHSEGGRLAQAAALEVPELVKALVLIEPAGAYATDAASAMRLKDIAHCVVWGDFFDQSALWQRYRASAERWFSGVTIAGGLVDVIDLPTIGIKGNTHVPMMDANSRDIAELVSQWLSKQSRFE